ncbi:MAG: S41 family peptidase [Fusobacteriaceae bacterium]
MGNVKINLKKIIVGLFITIGSLSYANEKTNNRGFLSNIRELKEISDIIDLVSDNHVGEKEVDKKELLHGALKGIVDALEDPHSNYLTKDNMSDFREDIKGKYPGVGMIIQKKKDEPLLVVSPIEDTPAYKAGIKPKDKILSINDESTLSLTSDESAKKLKGEAGTKVKLKVYRESLKETKEIQLTREIIKLKYVKSNMLKNNIGYLRLTQFGENVYPDLAKELTSLQKNGMKGLVLDLRNNPGGALDQAVKISSMFIEKGKIVTTRGRNKDEQISMREGKYFGDFPLVILINNGSASASEIVSGAVKDYKRGTLIGDKSFGKGSVQTLIPLPDGDGIKLTIAKYYTPNNISIHGIGIEPDIKVKEDEDYLLFDSVVTNVSEEATKENRAQIIKEIKGEDKAKEYEEKIDYQLDKAIEVISKKIGIDYIAKIPPIKAEDEKNKK